MKNVLLISQTQRPFQAPERTVSAQRTYGYSRYLPECGWRPIVICGDHTMEGRRHVPTPEEIRRELAEHPEDAVNLRTGTDARPDLVHTAYGVLRARAERGGPVGRVSRLARRGVALYATGTVPLESRAWLKQPREAIANLVRTTPIDACVASIFPDATARLAAELAARHGVPWIADFRDHVRTTGHRIIRVVATRRMRRLVESAGAIVTVSGPLADQLSKDFGRPVEVVTNGYFEEEYEALEPTPADPTRVRFVYTGTIYGPRLESLRTFLRGLGVVQRRRGGPVEEAVVFRYFGPQADAVRDAARGEGVEACVEVGGSIDREEALREQLGADVLLMITWDDPALKGNYSAKIFEYLRAGRPILTVPSDRDVVDALVRRARAGAIASTPEAIADRVLEWVAEKHERGAVLGTTDPAVTREFTRRSATRRLAETLDRITR